MGLPVVVAHSGTRRRRVRFPRSTAAAAHRDTWSDGRPEEQVRRRRLEWQSKTSHCWVARGATCCSMGEEEEEGEEVRRAATGSGASSSMRLSPQLPQLALAQRISPIGARETQGRRSSKRPQRTRQVGDEEEEAPVVAGMASPGLLDGAENMAAAAGTTTTRRIVAAADSTETAMEPCPNGWSTRRRPCPAAAATLASSSKIRIQPTTRLPSATTLRHRPPRPLQSDEPRRVWKRSVGPATRL